MNGHRIDFQFAQGLKDAALAANGSVTPSSQEVRIYEDLVSLAKTKRNSALTSTFYAEFATHVNILLRNYEWLLHKLQKNTSEWGSRPSRRPRHYNRLNLVQPYDR
jgi:hypothetical protein